MQAQFTVNKSRIASLVKGGACEKYRVIATASTGKSMTEELHKPSSPEVNIDTAQPLAI